MSPLDSHIFIYAAFVCYTIPSISPELGLKSVTWLFVNDVRPMQRISYFEAWITCNKFLRIYLVPHRKHGLDRVPCSSGLLLCVTECLVTSYRVTRFNRPEDRSYISTVLQQRENSHSQCAWRKTFHGFCVGYDHYRTLSLSLLSITFCLLLMPSGTYTY